MAKGQKRSTREIRKPKQEKAATKVAPTFGSQVKLTAKSPAPRSGGKS